MSNKLDKLKELRKKFDMEVNGLDNYPLDTPNVLIANHNCLMDIFFLPMSLSEDIVSLVSARLIYKKETERQRMVEKYLYGMPIEAHGGPKYSEMCINCASDILSKGNSVGIFPEGAYIKDNVIHRGRTGATRVLYNSKMQGTHANLIPVAIDVDKGDIDLDSYSLEGKKVKISILDPIDYDDFYKHYISTDNVDEKREMLHKPIDIGLSLIASTLDRDYSNEYIELFPKGNIILENGEVIPTDVAQDDYYLSLYQSQLEIRKQKILSRQ